MTSSPLHRHREELRATAVRPMNTMHNGGHSRSTDAFQAELPLRAHRAGAPQEGKKRREIAAAAGAPAAIRRCGRFDRTRKRAPRELTPACPAANRGSISAERNRPGTVLIVPASKGQIQ